jgi:hypothetical protein
MESLKPSHRKDLADPHVLSEKLLKLLKPSSMLNLKHLLTR